MAILDVDKSAIFCQPEKVIAAGPETLLTTLDVSRLLGISIRTVARYEELGILRAARLPRPPHARRFREQDIRELLERMDEWQPRNGRPTKTKVEKPGTPLDQEVRDADASSSG